MGLKTLFRQTLFRQIDEVLTLEGAFQKQGRHIKEEDLGILEKAALLVENGNIVWIGKDQKIPKVWNQKKPKEISLKGSTLLPGFVECHTHSVFAGSRAAEFELRNQGVSYQAISAQGGGILSTVRATRKMPLQELRSVSQERVDRFVQQGVTTLEIKSGYGLSLKDEIKMLKVTSQLMGPKIVTTFLGAHARPPEFDSYETYLDYLAEKVLPEVKKKKWAQRVDVFIEKGFFEAAAAEKYLSRAQALGFQVTIHADQLSLSGGSEVALRLKALSADHVICIQEAEIRKFADSQTTCVLLPAADMYMKCAYPPARKLIDAGARVALATDFNPGTSPTQDLSLVGLLARLEMKMTLPEVIGAYTVGAAYALDLQHQVGSLEKNKSADFLCINTSWRDLFYQAGRTSVTNVYKNGVLLKSNS